VAGVVEREPVVDDRPAPAADRAAGLEQQAAATLRPVGPAPITTVSISRARAGAAAVRGEPPSDLAGGATGRHTESISSRMARAVASQEVFASAASARCLRPAASSSDSASDASHAAMKPACESAIRTIPSKHSTTSLIGVLTLGLPAAMYSSVLVGLMKRVESLSANGSRHTSHCATSPGRSW
jgi:hypothetical protein